LTIPTSTALNTTTADKKTLPTKQNNISTKGILLISDNNGGFENINGEVVIPKRTFIKTEGAVYYENVNRNKFPKNLGIVTLHKEINQDKHVAYAYYKYNINRSSNYYVRDLIDNKGKRHFNSDRISFIGHLYGDWFVIGSDFYGRDFYSFHLGNAKLYNLKSKKEFLLPISPYHNAVEINKYDDYRYSVSNPSYITGSYISLSEKKESREILIDNLLGGSDKWKAYIFTSISISKEHTEHKIFYINSNDEIIELSASREDYYNLKH